MEYIDHKEINEKNNIHKRRTLTDDDVSALVSALEQHSIIFHNTCRFRGLDPEILGEAAEFYKKFNAMMDESGKIIWKTVLVAGVGGLILIIGLGISAKFKQIMEP